MNNELINSLCRSMTEYYRGDPARIQHFIKVRDFSVHIGECEKLDEKTLFTLNAAALVHDIGIKPAEAKYHSGAGKYQEELGPAESEKMMGVLGFDEDVIQRVSYLVGHHHTYTDIDGIDYQILVEADFLVNLYENNSGKEECVSVLNRIFRTEEGKFLLKTMFDIE